MEIDIELLKLLTGEEDETLLTFYADAVIKKIERMIGYTLDQKEVTEMVKGIDKNIIFPIRKPLKSVSDVRIYEESIEYNYNSNDRYVMIDRVLPQNTFVEVDYIAGYETIPNDLYMLISSLIKNEIASIDQGGLKNYKIKDISYTYLDNLENDSIFISKVFNIFGVY